MAQNQIKRVTPNHVAIVNWEIEHPGGTMLECAKDLGMADNSISVIRHSDAFIDYRAGRLHEHQRILSESIVDKATRVANAGLDNMHGRIVQDQERIDMGLEAKLKMDELRESTSLALTALGYNTKQNNQGNGQGAGTSITILNGADPELLERARAKMRAQSLPRVEEQKTLTAEVEDVSEQSLPSA